jgi:hypothetical protein
VRQSFNRRRSGHTLLLLAIALLATATTKPAASTRQPARQEAQRQGLTSARTPETILRDAREALGGDARLRGVKALVVDGYMVSDQRGKEYTQPYGFRMLLPDRFQMMDNPFGHTLDGAECWMKEDVPGAPPASDDLRRTARRATESRFYREAVTFLLQAPAGFAVQTRAVPSSGVPGLDGEAIELTRHGAQFPLVMVFDQKTHRPVALVGKALRSNPDMGDAFTVTNVTRLEDFRAVDGIQFPFRLDDRLGDDLHVTTTIQKVLVNPPLTQQDFKRVAK